VVAAQAAAAVAHLITTKHRCLYSVAAKVPQKACQAIPPCSSFKAVTDIPNACHKAFDTILQNFLAVSVTRVLGRPLVSTPEHPW
jgi:hypothetical protein